MRRTPQGLGPKPRPLLALTLAMALLVPLTAVFELALGEWQRRRVPTLAQWTAAARAATAASHDPSDALVVVPRWAGPLGRMALGAAANQQVAARSDLDTSRKVLTFGLAGHQDPMLVGTSLRLVDTQRFGPLEMRTYERATPARLVRDLVADFDEHATVARHRRTGEAEGNCRLEPDGFVRMMGLFVGPATPRRRFICPPFDPAGSFVAPTVISDLRFVPRRCLFVPPWGSSILRVELPKGPVGHHVVAYVGLHAFNERELVGPPVHARISIANQTVAETIHQDGEGWKRFEGSTAALAGREETVVLETWLDGPPEHGGRPVCLAAELRD